MYKQRLVTFFELEEAEEFAKKVNGICIPKLDIIDGEFYEWFEVWYIYYYDPRWQETWKDWLVFILYIIGVVALGIVLSYVFVSMAGGIK